jgi:hypothetical protein
MNYVSRRARIIVQANRAFVFVRAAADIENFHTLFFITGDAEKLKCKKIDSRKKAQNSQKKI